MDHRQPGPQPDAAGEELPPEREPVTTGEELPPEHEPVTTGTLFILLVFLMALAGMWGIMYFTLLGR